MSKWTMVGPPCALIALALVGSDAAGWADPPAPMPVAPADAAGELATLREHKNILKNDLAKYSTNQVELAALNRARTGLAIAVAQEAILLLRSDRPEAYDEAAQLIRESESYNLAIDTSTLSLEDLRVHADLQGLSRRALAAQVDYLRRRLDQLSPAPQTTPAVRYVPVTYYQPAPTVSQVATPAPARVVYRRGLFRCPTTR